MGKLGTVGFTGIAIKCKDGCSFHFQIVACETYQHSTDSIICLVVDVGLTLCLDALYDLDCAARSLLGGLGNNLGVQGMPHEISCSEFLFQQCRTFIQMRTNLKVVDNSGAKRVMCIQALKGKKGARLGDTIVASVKESQPGGKVKKGDVVYGVVVRAAMPRGRCDGSEVKFDDNAVVLVNKQGEPIGTRVFGPVPHELRKKKHVKILSLAEHIA
ncbi:unnamed protein product [Camellia sinensis]